MAEINVGVRPTNDPQYTNFSQGTDRATMQPLADVPNLSTKYVQPDWPTNKAAGTAIKDLGDIGESALKLTDAVIQKKADDMLTEGVEKIRNSFGNDQAVSGTAGTAEAVGKGGADGVELSDPQANSPVAVQRLGSQVGNLVEAYNQGKLSNPAYFAKLETLVRQTKAQFPGYGNEIDQMIQSKVGVQPANALRSSLLTDVAALQTKVQAMNDKQNSFYHENARYIYVAPELHDFDQRRAAGNPYPFSYVESVVGKYKADDYRRESEGQQLTLDNKEKAAKQDDAERQGLEYAGHVSRNIALNVQNRWGIKTGADFQNFLQKAATGQIGDLSPDDKQVITGLFSAMKQQAGVAVDQFMNERVSKGGMATRASILADKARLGGIREAAQAPIQEMQDAIFNKDHGILAQTLQHNQAVREAADGSVLKQPEFQTLGAINRETGNQVAAQVALQESVLPKIMQGIQNIGLEQVRQGQPLQTTIDTFKQEAKARRMTSDNLGLAVKMHIQNQTGFIADPAHLADPKYSDKSFQSLYGPGNEYFINQMSPSSAVGAFGDLYSQRVTDAVAKRSDADKQTYTNTAKSNFASIFETQARAVNQLAESYKQSTGSRDTKIEYDPKSMQFTMKTPSGSFAPAQNNILGGLNKGLAPMKRIFEMTKEDPTKALYGMLSTAGIEPGSPIYSAIQRAFLEEGRTGSANP